MLLVFAAISSLLLLFGRWWRSIIRANRCGSLISKCRTPHEWASRFDLVGGFMPAPKRVQEVAWAKVVFESIHRFVFDITSVVFHRHTVEHSDAAGEAVHRKEDLMADL